MKRFSSSDSKIKDTTMHENPELKKKHRKGAIYKPPVLPKIPHFPGSMHIASEMGTKSKSPLLAYSPDMLSVSHGRGFRLTRANAGIHEGSLFFEVELLDTFDTSTGCNIRESQNKDLVKNPFLSTSQRRPDSSVRIGFSTRFANCNTPVGFDSFGYGLCCKTLRPYHNAHFKSFIQQHPNIPTNYSPSPGDIFGCYLFLPHPTDDELEEYKFRQTEDSVTLKEWKLLKKLANQHFQVRSTGSFIAFFLNGQYLGVAFSGNEIFGGLYYPSISCFMGGQAKFHFRNFKYGIPSDWKPPKVDFKGPAINPPKSWPPPPPRTFSTQGSEIEDEDITGGFPGNTSISKPKTRGKKFSSKQKQKQKQQEE